MAFPKPVAELAHVVLALEPGAEHRVEFQTAMSADYGDSDEHWVAAFFDGERRLVPFVAKSFLEVELRVPENMDVRRSYTVELEIRNTGDHRIGPLVAHIDLPWGVELTRERKPGRPVVERSIGPSTEIEVPELPPRSATVVAWDLVAEVESPLAVFTGEVLSRSGGRSAVQMGAAIGTYERLETVDAAPAIPVTPEEDQ